MKKTLLLSVVASTMIMAGGDIAPVEPVVEAPVEAAAWNFEGQAVLYYQTIDNAGTGDLFDQGNFDGPTGGSTEGISFASAGISLKASNADLFAGIGAGVKVVGLGTLGLDEDVVSRVMQVGEVGEANSGAVTEAYLTYTADSIKSTWKVGRQTLPKSLSPFAFSESWNVFQNTFEAALMVNTYFTDTAIVLAHVTGANNHGAGSPGAMGSLGDFTDINDDGTTMLTLQNKSFEGVTLTGTYYVAPDLGSDLDLVASGGDLDVLWGDAKFAISDFNIALQGGMTSVDVTGAEDTEAFGAKIGTTLGMFDVSVAYSSVNDGNTGAQNLGTLVKTPLYTQMVGNQDFIKTDADTFVVRAGMEALGGHFGLAYDYTDYDKAESYALTDSDEFGARVIGDSGEYTELDFTYKTTVFNDSTTLFAAYVYQDVDSDFAGEDWDNNIIRLWGRYNF